MCCKKEVTHHNDDYKNKKQDANAINLESIFLTKARRDETDETDTERDIGIDTQGGDT